MHMADALISPAVGGTMWAATAAVTFYSAGKLKEELDEQKVPLMGVLGAFIFAAQMINFSIPATGSSGHLGGGMILSILLGPHAAFLVMASILTVQALFFADGGLLALGCNIFNLGFWPCFVAYPLVFRKATAPGLTRRRILVGSVSAAVLGLQLGSLGVVLQTVVSGVSELPFATFLMLMQPIHLAIGGVEGIVTTAVVSFVWKARPEVLEAAAAGRPLGVSIRRVLAGLGVAAVLVGGGLSWFASTHPDGLEWAISRTAGTEEREGPAGNVHRTLAEIQERTAILPDYGFKEEQSPQEPVADPGTEKGDPARKMEGSWPAVSGATTVSGLVGAILTLFLAGILGFVLRMAIRNR
jgi:cobalt/nickel transport system permease protein